MSIRPKIITVHHWCVVLAAISCLFALSDGKAQRRGPKIIERVEVIGYRRLTKDDVRAHIKMRAGQEFSHERSKRDLDEILATDLFDKRQTRVFGEDGTRGGVVVIFEVVEMPLIRSVSFEGMQDIEKADILKVFRANKINLENGAVYNPVTVQTACRSIEQLLISHGWSDAKVIDTMEYDGMYVSIVFRGSPK